VNVMNNTGEKPYVPTASGAIVMSLGIFLNGAVAAFPLLNRSANLLSGGLFLVWLWIAVLLAKPALARRFGAAHVQHPLQSFAIGTWVAGTSVCAVVILKKLPEWEWIAAFLVAVGFALWLFYLGVCARNFHAIFSTELKRNVDGVILLSTVSTQSLVILMKTQHFLRVPNGILITLLLLGGGFYVLCFSLILIRYRNVSSWNLADDWKNTNCILHGAMSITGLAGVVSGVVEGRVLFAIWLWVLSWFVIVETIEISRALLRIRGMGWTAAIGTYHVSQWSRIFTFGMLYAFTLNFNPVDAVDGIPLLSLIREGILAYGSWIVLLLILNEGLLMLKKTWSDQISRSAGRRQSLVPFPERKKGNHQIF